MPKRTNPFQQLVGLLERVLQLGFATVTDSKEIPDRFTGAMREIDIYVETLGGPHPVVLSIECTAEQRPATVEWVEQMHAKHLSLPTMHLVLVARAGFTPSAKRKADQLNVSSYSLKEAESPAWAEGIRQLANVRLESFIHPWLTYIGIVLKLGQDSEAAVGNLDFVGAMIRDVEGKLEAPDAIANRWLADPSVIAALEENAFTDADTVISFERGLKAGTMLVEKSGRELPLAALKIEAKCRRQVGNVPLTHTLYGAAAVAYGEGTSLGRPVQVVLAEQEPASGVRVGVRVSKPKDGRSPL